MIKLLVVLGFIFIGLALWKGRDRSVSEQQELTEMKQIRDELREAQKEVGSLMNQLEEVSEKIVEEISSKIEEARSLQIGAEPADSAKAETKKESADDHDEESADEFADDSAVDIANDSSDDSAVDFAGEAERDIKAFLCSREERSEAEEKLRRSLALMKENADSSGTAGGKTVPFPLNRDHSPFGSAGGRKETAGARELPSKHQMVYAMAKLGYSEAEIAQQMQIGKGEVNLMLQLKRKGEEANA